MLDKIFFKSEARMFKSVKAAKKIQNEKKFKQPVVKKINNSMSHRAERTPMQRIASLSQMPKKRKTLYRVILSLSSEETDRNVFMIADILFSSIIRDTSIIGLFYKALDKLFQSAKAFAIEAIALEYLIAQISIDKGYHTFAEYLLSRCPATVLEKREVIAQLLDDPDFGRNHRGKLPAGQLPRQGASEPFYLLRG